MKYNRTTASIFFMVVAALTAMAQNTVQSLNDGWTFSTDSIHWQSTALPHTWNTDAYTTRDYKQGKCFYRRTLKRQLTADQRCFLKVEAAFKTAVLYVNGKPAGRHRGGYTASVFDLTPYLCGTDELLIAVDNADPHVAPVSADFTFMGGIYRNVKLMVTRQQHFSMTEDGADGVFVTVSQVNAKRACVSVAARIDNDAATSKDCYVTHTLYAPDGRLLAVRKKHLRIPAGQTIMQQTDLPEVKQPMLWSPEHPHLYRVKTELWDNTSLLDRQEHSVGLRWCSFDAQKGFFLNGLPYKLNGMCRHQDWQPYGIALDDDMHRRDLRMLKDMGCNFIRLAHYPQAESALEMCDKLGMLVWEEIPVINYVPDDEAFADNACQQLREMIRQHYNHPSVILWGYMNEILLRARNEFPAQQAFTKEVERINALAARLERIVHEEDATRHSTMALHGSNDYHKYGISRHSQVLGWNLYQGWYSGELSDFERYLERQQRDHPHRPVIVSEWGAGSDLRLHSVSGGKAFDFSCEYQQQYIEHYLPVISDTPYVMGGSYWNFIDFSSANRSESMPHINNKGVVTAERKKKDVFYYFQAAWRNDKTVLHIATRDWPERETVESRQQVKVYSNAEEVELLVNGQTLGRRPTKNHLACFNVEWREGANRLEARAAGIVDQTIVHWRRIAVDARQISELAVNVGSLCYFQSAKTGVTWAADRPYTKGSWGYVGGKPSVTQAEIQCTEDDPLYQTQRIGIEGYRFDVPSGRYELELLFADTRQKQASSAYLLGKDSEAAATNILQPQRFDIEVNGLRIEEDCHPAAEAGYFTAVRRCYTVEATQEGLLIRFVPKTEAGTAFLSGIKIRRI